MRPKQGNSRPHPDSDTISVKKKTFNNQGGQRVGKDVLESKIEGVRKD